MENTPNQISENHFTYTVSPENEAQGMYSVEPETDVNFVPAANSHSTVPTELDPQLISVCICLRNGGAYYPDDRRESISERQKRILSHGRRVENYLRERRIPELIRFMTAKIMCSKPVNVSEYTADLLDKCMTFRLGHGEAPVLFEERHLEAVVKSFDPCNRGWLSAGQVRRAFTTIGLTPKSDLEVKTPTPEVLKMLRKTQEWELFSLLSAESETDDEFYE